MCVVGDREIDAARLIDLIEKRIQLAVSYNFAEKTSSQI